MTLDAKGGSVSATYYRHRYGMLVKSEHDSIDGALSAARNDLEHDLAAPTNIVDGDDAWDRERIMAHVHAENARRDLHEATQSVNVAQQELNDALCRRG